MEKIVGSALKLSPKKDFLIGHVQIKTYGLQTLFFLFNIKNRKCFGSAFPIPPTVTKLIRLHTVVVLHCTRQVACLIRGGGGEVVKMPIKNLL